MFKVDDVIQMFLLITWNMFYTLSSVSFVEFEQVNVNWVSVKEIGTQYNWNSLTAIFQEFRLKY